MAWGSFFCSTDANNKYTHRLEHNLTHNPTLAAQPKACPCLPPAPQPLACPFPVCPESAGDVHHPQLGCLFVCE